MVRPASTFADDEPTVLEIVDSLLTGETRLPEAQPRAAAHADWAVVRAAPFFDGLPNEALRTALHDRAARVLTLVRDQLLPLDGLVLVVRGQIALGRFAGDVLDEERFAAAQLAADDDPLRARKREQTRREEVGALMTRAEQNLAVFEEGDLVEPSAAAPRHASVGLYALTPATVLLVDRATVERWSRVHGFFADRLRRGLQAAETRLAATDGAQAAVADFFVRHGLSVSLTLRVRKIDTCIECKACEQACEARYGVKRLSINGRILGGLDFVDACHTCTDARCVDPCNYDAISFDPVRKEVLIKEDACTGCTLCARACPYEAIVMHELDETPLLQLRLERQGALAFGDGTPRKARLRRIASKCDHCVAYDDQACISACPTGALLELAPSDVVPALPERLRQSARSGFDESVAIDVRAVNSPAAFAGELDVPELGRARAPRTRLLFGLWWTVGLAAVLLAAVEIALRKLWPAGSIAYLMETRIDGVDADVALMHVDYHAGCVLAVNLGWVGTGLLVTSMAYVLRKRLGFLANAGALQAWFDWHVVSSVIGSAMIAMHTAARLDNWVAVPFWAMMGAVASGLLGRYLTTRLPAARADVERLELEQRLDELARRERGVRAASVWIDRYRQRIAARSRRPGFVEALRALAWLLADDVARGARLRRLRRTLRRSMPGWRRRRARRQALRLADAIALAERRRALVDPLLPLFMSWKAVHVPMATLLSLLGALHIVLALRNL